MRATKGRQQFKIQGMDCAEEVAVLKREVGAVAGGPDRVSCDLLNARITVEAGPSHRAADSHRLTAASDTPNASATAR